MAEGKEFSVKAIISAIDRFSRPFGRMMLGASQRLDGFATKVLKTTGAAALGGGALIAAGKGIVDFAKSYTEGADNISKASRRIGISTDSLQEYRFAAGLAGVATNEFDGAMEAFGRNLGDLKLGRGPMMEFLGKADPAFAKTLKGAASAEDALDAMMMAFLAIEDPNKRAALAAASFGDAGRKMILMMEGGADGLRDARKQAHDFGAVIGEEALRKTEAFNDSLSRMESFAGGFKNRVGGALIEALQPQLNAIEAWVRENPEKIRKAAEDIGKWLAKALERIVEAFRWIVDNKELILVFLGAMVAVKIINGVAELASAFKGIAMSVKAIAGGKGAVGVLSSLVGLGSGGTAAAGAAASGGSSWGLGALASNPLAWVTGGVVATAAAAPELIPFVGNWLTNDAQKRSDARATERLAARADDQQRRMKARDVILGGNPVLAAAYDAKYPGRRAAESTPSSMDRTISDLLTAGLAGGHVKPQELVVTVKAAPGTEASVDAATPETKVRGRNTGVPAAGRGRGVAP